MSHITADKIRLLLSYNPEDGTFFWLIPRGPLRVGARAGSVNSEGYLLIMIDKHSYGAHRLAWLLMTGE